MYLASSLPSAVSSRVVFSRERRRSEGAQLQTTVASAPHGAESQRSPSGTYWRGRCCGGRAAVAAGSRADCARSRGRRASRRSGGARRVASAPERLAHQLGPDGTRVLVCELEYHHELVGRDDGNPRERHRRLAVPFDHRRGVGRGGGAKLRMRAEADAELVKARMASAAISESWRALKPERLGEGENACATTAQAQERLQQFTERVQRALDDARDFARALVALDGSAQDASTGELDPYCEAFVSYYAYTARAPRHDPCAPRPTRLARPAVGRPFGSSHFAGESLRGASPASRPSAPPPASNRASSRRERSTSRTRASSAPPSVSYTHLTLPTKA